MNYSNKIHTRRKRITSKQLDIIVFSTLPLLYFFFYDENTFNVEICLVDINL